MKSGAKYLLLVLTLVGVTLFGPTKASAAGGLTINEFVSTATSGDTDWVELYNGSGASVSLNGWYLRDTAASNLKTFTASDEIPAGGFFVTQVGTRLGNTGDTIELHSPSGLEDSITYPAGVAAPAAGQSAGRNSDGAGSWAIFNVPTKGASNNPAPLEYGEIRVHTVIDANQNGLPNFNAGEPHQANMPIRVYKVSNGNWSLVDQGLTTGKYYLESLRFTVPTGHYALCQPKVTGYTQSFGRSITGWVSFPDTSTSNLSGASDEYAKCISLSVQKNKHTSHVFGLLPEAN